LLLLHGFTGSARTWDQAAGRWQAGHRVIVPDLLGHGRSAAPADPARYALEVQSADLATLLDELDVGPADVVGYSMGARLALHLALLHPDRVSSLVLESPSAGIEDGSEREARRSADERLALTLEQQGLATFVEMWQAQPLFASHARLSPEDRERLQAERMGHDPRGLAASLRGAGQGVMAPLHDRLGAIGCPALVMAGSLDAPGLGRARLVAAGLPHATLAIVAGAGHTPHLEQPQEFLRLASEHLDRTSDRMSWRS
jgi:2-succinyl-6-hydroxy-2,4-cyclohexadiene-1-carboxylate synthase